jgi:predicted PurR-regulated permease PerM
MNRRSRVVFDGVEPWLRSAGLRSWLYLGIVLWAAVLFYLVSTLSGLVVPLIVAIIIGMLFYPVVDLLERYRIPRVLGTTLVMLGLLAVMVFITWLMVVGVIANMGEVVRQVQDAARLLLSWLNTLEQEGLPGIPGVSGTSGVPIDVNVVEQVIQTALNSVPNVASLAANLFTSTFSGTITVIVGTFMGGFLLFYLLADWQVVSTWVGNHLGIPGELGARLVADATVTIRRYFYALTMSSVLVSVTVWATMAALGLPLALTTGLVTMITSYIPYLGAVFSGVFAFVVALGAGGIVDAMIVLAVVLLMQNIIQTLVQNQLASDQLRLHPIVTFISTVIGATVAGLMGAMLGAPVTAMTLSTQRRFNEFYTRIRAEELAAELTSEAAAELEASSARESLAAGDEQPALGGQPG